MKILAGGDPMRITAALVVVLILVLHAPVFTQGLLITPAGMHHAQWPWNAYRSELVERGVVLEENEALGNLLLQVYPWQVHIERTLGAGTIPLWNPHSYCGVPFVGNVQSAVFYPLHWPGWIFPSTHVFTLALIGKMLLAGVFMAFFLRGLGCGAIAGTAGAIAFALGGYMTSWLGYPSTNAAIFLPLLMHAARTLASRPGANGFLLLAFAGACQYLGGHPGTSLHIMGVAGIYHLWCLRAAPRPRLSVGLFITGGVAGFGLASIQLFPFLDYLRDSAALAIRSASPGIDPALPARSLMTWLMPNFYGRPDAFTYEGPAAFQAIVGYVGAGVATLALVSLRWWRSTGFFALLVAACGAMVYAPAWLVALVRRVPLVGITSSNGLLLVIGFGLATMAALSLQRVVSGEASETPGRRRTLVILAGVTTAVLVLVVLSRDADPDGALWAGGIIGGTTLFAAIALLRAERRLIYATGILMLLCLDMIGFAHGFNPHADPGALFPATPLTDFLRQDAAAEMTRGGRIMTIGQVMRPDTHMIYRLHSIEGHDALEPLPYRRLLDRAGVASIHESGIVPDASRPLLDLMGLRYLVTPPGGVVSGPSLTLAYDGPDGRVFVNDRAAPRFTFVGTASPAGDDALDRLAAGGVDIGREVLLHVPESEIGSDAGGGEDVAGTPEIVLERNTSNSLTITVRGHGRPGWLVVNDAYDDGWRARVNGVESPVTRANHWFRAVRLSSSDATVVMVYRPGAFRAGVWVSGITLLVILAVAIGRWGADAAPPDE